MKIKLRKSDCRPDWYLIVRAEHDGRIWIDKIGDVLYNMKSERLSPEACIEGNSEEMIDIANAIKSRQGIRHKRVGVRFEEDGVHLYSPRNSEHDGIVTVEEANELADQILKDLIQSSVDVAS